MDAIAEQLELSNGTGPDPENDRKLQDQAFARVQRIGNELLNCRTPEATLEEWAVVSADLRTSLADARTAKSVAAGVPMGDIDPATGNEHSVRIYNALRKSWQRSYDRTLAGYLGWDLDKLMQVVETARREFIAKRPDLDDGMPWITER
jgi:hypothetical protein